MILKNLDLMSLRSISRVNKRLNILTQDPFLITCLNLRNVFPRPGNEDLICNYKMMSYFTSRCKYLQQLDFTEIEFVVEHFVEFLNICGSRLTHLRLRHHYDNSIPLFEVSRIRKNLQGI